MAYIHKSKEDKNCGYCSVSFRSGLKWQRFCSNKCQSKSWNENYVGKKPEPYLSPGTVGALSELIISIDLLRRGYEVFRALSPSCSCDLAIFKNGQLKRIEVRTGWYTKTGKAAAVKLKERDKIDILAIYIRVDNSIHYLPELKD